MTITVKNNSDKKISKAMLYKYARRYIILANFDAACTALNNFIIKETKLNLRIWCLRIISNAIFDYSDLDSITVYITNKEYDKMARLITFGNGVISGCDLLKKAFTYFNQK